MAAVDVLSGWLYAHAANQKTSALISATSASVAAAWSHRTNEEPAIYFTSKHVGTVTAWLWDFGDTTSSTLRDPSHAYSVPVGSTLSFTVKLTVNAGPESEVAISVSNPLPSSGAGALVATTLSAMQAKNATSLEIAAMVAE